jgi:hypothetical protein
MALALVVLLCLSCRTLPPLPPADFAWPGWRLQQGQALWKPSRAAPELAGDLLLATNSDGSCVVQFSKTPFSLATAQVADDAWQIVFGDNRHSWRGQGLPPPRFAWFQLPHALAGLEPPRPWRFSRRADNSWRLENARTGEVLEGMFFP